MSATHVIKGVVESTRSKTVKTVRGDSPVYHTTVDGVEFSTGFTKKYSDGEMVTVGVAWKYANWQEQEGPISSGLPAAVAGGGDANIGRELVAARGGKGSGAFPVDPKSGQISIIRQNSMNRAVEILGQWHDQGVFTAPDETSYLKKLIEVALTVTDFNSGQDIMKLAAAQAANTQAVT